MSTQKIETNGEPVECAVNNLPNDTGKWCEVNCKIVDRMLSNTNKILIV